MMAWVHASVGAAVGARVRSRGAAFVAGAVSHLVCDLAPHRDFEIPVELPLVAIALTAIAARYGMRSCAMSGAIGAVAPDIENGLDRLGAMPGGTLFPTHTDRSWFIGHGRKVRSPLPQILLAGVCIAALEHLRRESCPPTE